MNTSLEESVPVLACSEIGKLHSLAFAGIPVYAGSCYEQNTALYSRYVKKRIHLPDYGTEEFIHALCEFGKEQPRKTVLMTDDDQAALTISRHRKILEKYFLFLLSDHETVEAVQDKQKFYEKAGDLGLQIPTSFTISSLKELRFAEEQLSFPCIVKPVNKEDWWHKDYKQISKSNKKALRCATSSELYKVYEQIKQFNSRVIVQELVEGPDDQHYSVNMYIDQKGEIRGYYLYQKVRMCPPKAGRGSYLITVQDKEVIEEAKHAARALGMRGLINIQFKRNKSGAVKLIEVEPRLSVSSFLGVAAGANLAVQYYYDLIGGKVPSYTHYHSDIKYFDLIRDVKASFQYWKQGELSFTEWVKSYRGTSVCNGYSLKDPFPIFMSIWFIISLKLKKFGI